VKSHHGARPVPPTALFLAGFALLLAVLFFDPLFRSRTFLGRDLVQFFLPVEKAVHDSWRQGRVPIWMPDVSFGRPLAANPNAGVFYPLRVGMAALPFPVAFKLFPVLHLWLAGVGTFLLSRLLGTGFLGASLAALVFALCGPAVASLTYPNILPGLAALPFVLWAAARWARAPSARAAAHFGLVWGLDLLVGDVFTAGLALLGSLLLVWEEAAAGGRARRAAGLLLISMPGFLLAGIQILPALLFVPLTVRGLGRFLLGEILRWSVPAWRLAELFVPFPFGNVIADRVIWGDRLFSSNLAGFYPTLYSGAFATMALFALRPPPGKRLFLWGFASTSLLLAAAGFYLPRGWWNRPSVLPLRYPEKMIVGFLLVCALAAGFLFERLQRDKRKSAWMWPSLVAAGLLFAALAGWLAPRAVERFALEHWTAIPRLAEFASRRLPEALLGAAGRWAILAGVLFLWQHRPSPVFPAAALLLVTADLASVSRSIVETARSEEVFSAPPAARAVVRANRGSLFGFTPLQDYIFPDRSEDPLNAPFRTLAERKRGTLTGLTGATFGVFYSFNVDYDLSDFYRVDLVRRELLRTDGGPAGHLSSFSAHTTILQRGDRWTVFTDPIAWVGPDWLVRNPGALPTIRFAENVREARDVSQAFDLFRSGAVDLSKVAIVETGGAAAGSERLSGGRILVERARPDRLELRTETPGPARLVLVRAYSPFREVRVDGVSATSQPANVCLTSIPVPAGAHRVEVVEKLPGEEAGPALSACGLLLLAFLAVRGAPRGQNLWR
jgi:hypothetical protein